MPLTDYPAGLAACLAENRSTAYLSITTRAARSENAVFPK